MAFTIGSGTFTNGSATVTGVTLTSGTLAYFASGTRMVVGVNPVIQEVEAIAAPTVSTITLRSAWTGTGGTYSFLANQTSEGLRDAVQAIRTNNASLQSFIDSIDTAATADSVAQRTSDGSLNAVSINATGDVNLAAGKAVKFSATSYMTPENNVSGAEISTAGVLVVKTGSTPAERMRIDASGNAMIGSSASNGFRLGIVTPSSAGGVQSGLQVSDYATTDYNVTLNNGVAGVFAGNGQSLAFGNNNSTERMRIDSSGHAIIPAGITLGTAAGVYNAANTLDDYEEGTFTPSMTFGGGSVGLSFLVQAGQYTKIGRLVYVRMNFRFSSKGSSTGTAVITGLPFTATAMTGGFSGQGFIISGQSGFSSITAPITVGANESSNTVFFVQVFGSGGSNLTDANFNGNDGNYFSITGCYVAS